MPISGCQHTGKKVGVGGRPDYFFDPSTTTPNLKHLAERRRRIVHDLEKATNEEVRLRTTLELTKRLNDHSKGDLEMVVSLLSGMGTGDGKQATFLGGMHEQRWSDAIRPFLAG